VRQPVVVPGRLGERGAGRGEAVEPGLDPQVHPPLGLPQPGRVRERGRAVRPDGQAHQGIPEVTGADGGQLGRRGQPRPGRS